jgi:putative flippase GtrA
MQAGMALNTPPHLARSVHLVPEIVRYGLAGLVNTAVGFSLYSACILLLHAPFWGANFVAIIGGVICGYILARTFVFRSAIPQSHARSTPRYLLTIALQYGFSTLVISICLRYGVGEILGYVIALPLAMVLSYAIQKYWVFPSAERPSSEPPSTEPKAPQ